MSDQVIVENGRVSTLFKTINAIAIILISGLLIWIAATVADTSKKIEVLVSNNSIQEQHRTDEHARLERDRKEGDARLERRIAELERQRRLVERLDSRDE